MGANEGFVVGLKKLVDHGPATARWNLVIISEGYQIGEMPKFHQDANIFVDALFNTVPFKERWCAINIYRLSIASTDSRADDPAGGNCTGTGAMKATFFDATFCSQGVPRLLTINRFLATTTVQAHVPNYHVIIAIVNSAIYGGGGASPGDLPVAVYSAQGVSAISGLGKELAGIHELGHSGFALADEYPYGGSHHFNQGEPFEPNVTINKDKTTIKWKNLVTAAKLPTTVNADCTQEDPQPNPLPAGTVGAFEGAKYSHCGVYRPAFNCRMRELASPFCPVCAQVIKDTLAPFMAPASIAPVSNQIDFHDIPEGVGSSKVTVYRAAIFEVGSCSPVTLKVIAGPTGGFGLPLGSVVQVMPGQITSEGRVWVSYTSTVPGATASGDITVSCLETGEQWQIHITANTVARPKSAIVLVMDHSGSMSEDAGGGVTKVQKMREAAKTFIDVMLPGDGLGLVRFDDTAQIVQKVDDVATVAGNTKAAIESNQFNPAGATSIGAGLAKGSQALGNAQGYVTKAMVILTDGMENTPPLISQQTVTAHSFAVGLGLPSDVDVGKLQALTGSHEGYLLISGTLTQDQTFRLQKYFLQILAGITSADIVVDPQGILPPGTTQKIPFNLTEADYGSDVILLSNSPRSVSFSLETPGGLVLNPVSAGSTKFISTPQVSCFRLALPVFPKKPDASHAGQWNAVLRVAGRQTAEKRSLTYSLIVHTYSSLRLRAFATQSSHLPGAIIFLSAVLTEYDVPVDDRARVWAEVTRPDGTRVDVKLAEDEPGRFSASVPASQIGLYTIRIRAEGTTFKERRFTREKTLTAGILSSEPSSLPLSIGCPNLCQLIECLIRSKAIDRARLEKLGIKWDAFVDCARHACGGPSHRENLR